MDDKIPSPRIPFDETKSVLKKTKVKKRIEVGSKNAGVILDITDEGLYINGYYVDHTTDSKYASLLEPGFISWKNLEKAKTMLGASTKKSKKKKAPEEVEDVVSEEYLKTLPIVTIYDKQYYVDPDKGERRSVRNPNMVVKFSQNTEK
jgi:hypothetical protein